MKLGFISDIHEDIEQLDKALKLLEKQHCDALICLGDIVGYSVRSYRHLERRDANAVCDRIRTNCAHSILGNHDCFHAGITPQHPNGFDYGKAWFKMDFPSKETYANGKVWLYEPMDLNALLSDQNKAWLAQLPEIDTISTPDFTLLLTHWAVPNLVGDRSFFGETCEDFQEHLDFIEAQDARIGISGHHHLDGAKQVTRDALKALSWGMHQLPAQTQWLTGPCVVRHINPSGVMTLDTSTRSFELIPL